MSSSLPAKIDLTGDHPLAIWLAKSLQRRGWEIDTSRLVVSPYPWLGLAYDLIEPLGYSVPNWPLKWSFQHLELFYRPQQKDALTSWSADLLDLNAIWQEFRPVTRPMSASLSLNVSFCACQTRLLNEVSGVLKLTQPVGLLECYEGESDALCVSALDSTHVAYSYLWQGQERLRERLFALYPEHTWEPLDLSDNFACRCWPQVSFDKKQVKLCLPRPALAPQNMILQGLSWLLLASMIRWLSQDNLSAEQLIQRLSDSLNKFDQAQRDRLQKHNFFNIAS